MKIAEALSERADLQKRIAQLRERLDANARMQEGDPPAEDPQKLLAELDGCLKRYEELIARINLTNASVKAGGKTLTELIAKKDTLCLRIGALREFLDAASAKTDRSTRTEIRIQSSVDVPALQKTVDAFSRELRELDCALQAANWSQELQ